MSAIIDRLVSADLRDALRPRTPKPAPAPGAVRLNAGEAPSAPALDSVKTPELNRFPDRAPQALAARMAELYGVAAANLVPVADAPDAFDILVRLFTSADRTTPVVLAGRGLSAAKRAIKLQGAPLRDLAPTDRFEADILGALDGAIVESGGKAVAILATPTTETGALLPTTDIEALAARRPDALIIVDEAAIEFSGAESLAPKAAAADNLVVLRSLSRAYGLAGAPCGALIASEAIAALVASAVPRPLPRPSVQAALSALAPVRSTVALGRIADIVAERERLASALANSPYVARVWPSSSNVLAAETRDGDALARRLAERGLTVFRVGDIGVRITIGSPAENDLVLDAFDVATPAAPRRIAETSRETKETKIAIRVDLDASGAAKVSTGVGYFDHMLEQIAKHGDFALTLACEGDTEVDAHHTIEDCMLALGAALKEALGDKRGIQRFGFALPMDEAEAEVLIDLSGRPYAVFEGDFAATLLGEYPTEMTAHAFRSLAETMGAAIHVKVRGENDHHKTEAAFKAFGRAMRQAIKIEGDDVPSTKGVL